MFSYGVSLHSQLGLFGKPLIVNSPFPCVADFKEESKTAKTGILTSNKTTIHAAVSKCY